MGVIILLLRVEVGAGVAWRGIRELTIWGAALVRLCIEISLKHCHCLLYTSDAADES